jgi:hypothetical protein
MIEWYYGEIMRCPRCGNDAHAEEYICSFCGVRLKTEPIEQIPIFRRQEEKWVKRMSTTQRLIHVIKAPAKAFWDIKNDTDTRGPIMIILGNATIMGLWAVLVMAFIDFPHPGTITIGDYSFNWLYTAIYYIGMFLLYFLFGIVYYILVFLLWNALFSIGANVAVNLSKTIKFRYSKQEKEEMENAAENIAKGNEIKDTLEPKKPAKRKMMIYAYAPTLITNTLCTLVILFGLITHDVTVTTTDYTSVFNALDPLFTDTYVWQIIDVIQIITLVGWIPITLSISLRDLGNTSTLRLYVACVIMGILTSYMMFFVRPSLGWNLNIIDQNINK